ncbi:MAG: hypothetical protein WC351_00290 [Candidatus Izemoplasmatales bacterium]
MNLKLRTSFGVLILLAIESALFFFIAFVSKDILIWIFTFLIFFIFLITLVHRLGTRLTINDGILSFRRYWICNRKIIVNDIISTMIQTGKKRKYFLEISTPDITLHIAPFFNATLIDIQSILTGEPFDIENAHQNIVFSEKQRRKRDIVQVVFTIVILMGIFIYRLAVMNQAKIVPILMITPAPEFPSETDLETNYSVYTSEFTIQNEKDAANAALNALTSELSFISKLMNNRYYVFYVETEHFYRIDKFVELNQGSYTIYIRKGDNLVYFRPD